MNTETRLDRIQRAMFSDPSKNTVELSEKDIQIKHRYEKCFTFWLHNPHLGEKEIVRFLINECYLSRAQAYEDIKVVKQLLGNVTTASKEWYRHMVIEMARQAFELAKSNKDAKGMAAAADKIGKYSKLDKDELEAPPYEDIVPPAFEPDPDITLLGIPVTENIEQKRLKLREKYNKMFNPKYVQDAILVVDDPEDESNDTE